MSFDAPAKRLRHVVQRRSNDCMVATAAMIAGIEYDEAARQSPVSIGERGMFPAEIVRILESVTGVAWLGPKIRWWRPISRFGGVDTPFVVTIRRPWRWRTLHCVAVIEGCVHDPELACGLSLSEYGRAHWRVIHSYVPESIDQLVAVREHRKRQTSGMRAAMPRKAKHRW